jgi:threonine aldolase
MEYFFYDDYSEGAHPKILEALSCSNLEQERGYGEDTISTQAIKLIKQKIGNPNVAIHFVSSGMQANVITLISMLRHHESVITPETAHINLDEAGAIEAGGHKINAVQTPNGKLTSADIEDVLARNSGEHKVKPRVVAVAQATEWGTIYSKEELQALSNCCKKNNLYFYIDGARLGSALTAKNADITLLELSQLADAFYIGGTKNGALLGEAIVVSNPELQKDFRYHIKQRGALLAKGRVLGIQFAELFKDDLFFDLARHANVMAERLKEAISIKGFSFLSDSTTNQIFPILPNTHIEKLKKDYGFHPYGFNPWPKAEITEDTSAIRLVTSWATTEEAVNTFIADFNNLT